MADESTAASRYSPPDHRARQPRDGETNEAGRDANRRRIIITSLLTPPAVMTLNARRARAQMDRVRAVPGPSFRHEQLRVRNIK